MLFKGIPAGIVYLGFVSLLINVNGIMTFTMYPKFMTEILGVTMIGLGFIEGAVEFIAQIIRMFSGVISDFLRKRKLLLIIAYSVVSVSRPLIAFSSSAADLLFARSVDRLGNGLQASPRDALVSDLAPKRLKGACYGLSQSMKMMGSVIGAVLLSYMVLQDRADYERAFLLTLLPIAIAILVLVFFIKEKKPEDQKDKTKDSNNVNSSEEDKKHSFKLSDVFLLGNKYWKIITLAILFMLANYSGSFLIIHVGKQGGNESYVMLVQNIMTMLAAFPAAKLSDNIDRRIPLAFGFFILMMSGIVLANASGSMYLAYLGVALYGMQMGINYSLILTKIADVTKKQARGTAFGLYYLLSGVALFFSNYIGGIIWDNFSASHMFYTSSAIAFVSLILIPVLASDENTARLGYENK